MTENQTPAFRRTPVLILIGFVLLSLIAGVILYIKGFPPEVVLPGRPTPTALPAGTGEPQPSDGPQEPYTIEVALSEDASLPIPYERLPLAPAEALSPEEVQAILARLPALPFDPDLEAEFNRPPETLPPPRPGRTIETVFPPPDRELPPVNVASGPLQVLRFAPEGEIPIAPFVSVTFNQPMVPIGTLEDLAEEDVPVRIEPSLPGTWRWLGTKTLTFEYDSELIDRLPKSTEYRVRVPAGTVSAGGEILAEPVSWTFSTPAPSVVVSYPGSSPQPLEPLFFIAFDQRIDPAAVLETIQVSAGGRAAELVLAGEAEIEADERVHELAQAAEEGRWLAFRAREPFPADTAVSVTVGPGTPSAEGPLVTTAAQTFGFSTYAPLRITHHECSWYDDRCPPLTPFLIHFNNPLDLSAFSEGMLRIEPEIPGLTVNAYGSLIEIGGETRGQTTYTVTVSGSVRDTFGQSLGRDERLTFRVGKAERLLVGPGQTFVTLDPAASQPSLSVYAVNYSKLNLKIHAVEPADWPAFQTVLTEWYQSDERPALPGRQVENTTLSLDIPDDTLTEVGIDLSKYLAGDHGHFVVFVEPPAALFETEEDKWRRFSQTILVWVQVTQIGLDAYTDHSEMVAWATDLRDGRPLAGVSIQPDGGYPALRSGPDGVVRFDIPSGATYLTAVQGADRAILPRSNYYWGSDAWMAYPPNDSLRWYVYDDRGMYRPGEEVHIKGWLRRIGGRQDGDVSLVGGLISIGYQVVDPQGNVIGEGSTDANGLGGFDFVFRLPPESNLGSASINLTANGLPPGVDGYQQYHAFQIQEFRRPEFEVAARNETSGPYFAGGHATLAVEADYYAGGGLPGAETTWQVTTSPGSYSPPDWPEFTFGTWRPWWFFHYEAYEVGYPPQAEGVQTATFSGTTDASGTHYLGLDFKPRGDPSRDPQPHSVTAQATVMDVNRQAWSSTTTLLVHPADVYIGIRSDRYFVQRGTPLTIETIVTDLEGVPVPGRQVVLTAARLEWKYQDGKWTEVEVDVQTCRETSAAEPRECRFETPLGGSYKITAIVTDALGRSNQSSFTRWVSGGRVPASRKVEQEQVTLIPDRETYQPGDTAEILVQSPFSPAEGLLTVARSGILYTTRFRVEDGSATLRVPIEEEHIPNLVIQVDLVGAAERTDEAGEAIDGVPPRPAFASGTLNLAIPPLARTLSLEVTPDQPALEPGAETALTVLVRDARGVPLADAELSVVVVDEAILALTNYQLTDPLAVFYADRSSYLSALYGRTSIVLADPAALAQQANQYAAREVADAVGAAAPSATMSALMEAPAAAAPEEEKSGAAQQPAISLRSDFNPLASFSPSVRTGFDGRARVFIQMPDNLTRYRVMVAAVDAGGTQFGTGEANLTARLPLMLRPSAPRFLNFGDRFELPVVLQNQTDDPITVDVAARAGNLELAADGLRVTVPANDRVEVRFPSSTILAGTARVQFAAVSGSYADAAQLELPVYTPATSEAFATYGVIDEGAAAQPVQYPSGVFPQYGGLEITTSSTALQALTDAVLYLTAYPYECSEQLASRILAVAALRDVLTAFEAEGLPAPAEMEAAVERDLQRLQGMQNYDGGFPYWRRGFESIPFNTIHAAHAMQRASEKGFEVPPEMMANAQYYLRDIENYYPSWYSQRTRWTLSAYALYVRSLAGDRDAQKAQDLLRSAGVENLPLEALGWLWPVIDDPAQLDAIRLYVNNRVVETAGAANFTTDYDDQTYLLLSSDRRTDAILLDALMEDDPQSDLIPKLVTGLLAHRTRGHWGSTQDNVFVLLALDRYFNTYEAQTPDFVARIWLGDLYAGSGEFRGRTTDLFETLVPMSTVLSETASSGGTGDLIVSKDGPGRLYYRIGLRYAPDDLDLDPLEMGFVVQRRYEGLDDPADVRQAEDGTWTIKAGATVRVRITLVADNRRYHVALADPLPAGLEIINPALAVSQSIPQDPSDSGYRYGWWWWGPWYEHQNMRDDRAEAFTPLLWDGVYEYTYYARATTPGTFIVPPARAEEMYSPEVFGRSGSDRVIVE